MVTAVAWKPMKTLIIPNDLWLNYWSRMKVI